MYPLSKQPNSQNTSPSDIEAQALCKSSDQESKDPFGIPKWAIWTILPWLGTYPLLICWNLIVHIFFWVPFGILLAIYSVQDQANSLHTKSHQPVTKADRLLEQFPAEETAWILYYTSFGMACATVMTFMMIWYREKMIMSHLNTYQLQTSDIVEKISIPNLSLAQGKFEKEARKGGLILISLSAAYGKRLCFDIVSKIILIAAAAGIYVGLNMWLPISLELVTLDICDRLSPLSQPVTRVDRLLKDPQVDIQARALTTLALWILLIISSNISYWCSRRIGNWTTESKD